MLVTIEGTTEAECSLHRCFSLTEMNWFPCHLSFPHYNVFNFPWELDFLNSWIPGKCGFAGYYSPDCQPEGVGEGMRCTCFQRWVSARQASVCLWPWQCGHRQEQHLGAVGTPSPIRRWDSSSKSSLSCGKSWDTLNKLYYLLVWGIKIFSKQLSVLNIFLFCIFA